MHEDIAVIRPRLIYDREALVQHGLKMGISVVGQGHVVLYNGGAVAYSPESYLIADIEYVFYVVLY